MPPGARLMLPKGRRVRIDTIKVASMRQYLQSRTLQGAGIATLGRAVNAPVLAARNHPVVLHHTARLL